jgi:mono/diheme cytochrome c family protein
MKRKILSILVLSAAFMLCGAAQETALAGDSAETLFESKCSQCHSTQRPKSLKKTKKGWEETVIRMMKVNGAPINDEEAGLLIEYLTKNYGK